MCPCGRRGNGQWIWQLYWQARLQDIKRAGETIKHTVPLQTGQSN